MGISFLFAQNYQSFPSPSPLRNNINKYLTQPMKQPLQPTEASGLE